jgi:hypothetical protein
MTRVFPVIIRISLRTLIVGGVALTAFVSSAFLAYAAELSLSPSTGSYSSGQTFTANVRVNPQGKSVNAVEATLTFDTSKLSVVSVGKTGSAFSLWTTEPTFSNSAGTIQFGGGSPTPFSAASTLVVITFRATGEGSAAVDFKEASVLAADGLGTDVYSGSVKAAYTVNGAATPPPPTPTPTPSETPPAEGEGGDAAITFGDPPQAPEVISKTFLDPDIWYATSSGLFTWEVPFDVNELAVDISTSSDTTPTTKYAPPIEELFLTEKELADGVQYLHVQYKNLVGWGAIAHRKIMVDTTPPETFTINVRAGDTPNAFPILVFGANDKTSGVERYELTVADREPVSITPDEAKLGYLLGELVDGTYTVTVVAYDYAGNKTESSTPVLITAGWQPKAEEEGPSIFAVLFTFTNIFITLLLLLITSLVAYIVYERRQFSRKETKLRKETKEIQDQMEKIFSALRDEIQDQIKSITKKARLSKNEKVAVENLNSALEVSETLIEKEIVDVQKILK